jgi:hypothetical protein
MGLDRWFAQQLNPGSIDNSDLQARLAQYPAMRMSEEQLMQRFPTNQMIRAISNGLQPMPSDSTERAIYTDQIYFYNLKKQAEAGKAAPAGGDMGTQKDMTVTPGMVAGNDMASDAMMPAASAAKGKGKKSAAESARNGDAMSPAEVQGLLALPARGAGSAGEFAAGGGGRAGGDDAGAGRVQFAAVAGGDNGFLAESLQCLHQEE